MPLIADGLLLQTNLTGALVDIASDDGLWLTAISNNTDSVVAVSFPTPLNLPTTGAGLQSFTVKYRVTVNATSTTFNAYLRENGTRINGGTAIDTWTHASITEASRTIAWNASLLGTANGSLVEVEIVATATGGSPTSRTTGEFQFINWVNKPDDLDLALTTLNTPGLAVVEQVSDVNDALGVSTLNTPSFIVTTFPAVVDEGKINIVVPNIVSLLLSENVTSIKDNQGVATAVDPLIIAENLASVNAGTDLLTVNTQPLALTTNISDIKVSQNLTTLNTEVLAIVENAAVVQFNNQLDITTDSLTVTENTTNVNEARNLTVLNTSNLVVTELDAGINILLNLTVTTDSLVLTENLVSLSLDTGLVTDTGSLVVTEFATTVVQNVEIVTTQDSILITPNLTSAVHRPIERIVAAVENIVVTSFDTIVYTATQIVTIPPAVINIVERVVEVFYKETPYIARDIQELSAGSLVTLYSLDLTELGDAIYYFHAGTNELHTSVVWQGIEYLPFPIEARGFDVSSNGEIPRPTITVSNILGTIGSLARTLDDLVGAKVNRKRTFMKYLDAVNFADGNRLADPNVFFDDDVFYIDRKVSENASFIEFELSSNWDVEGLKVPKRQIIQNICPWSYRSSECSYAGGAVADASDNPTVDILEDSCSKSLHGCTLRFGENGILPFGGFPGAGLFNV
jgi:lambda family phage minor tail protein L